MDLSKDPEQIRGLFSCIAPVYDQMNRLFSWGLDGSWRRRVVDLLELAGHEEVLDICCGTGELTFALAKRLNKGGSVVGIDFTREMLVRAKEKARSNNYQKICSFRLADALNLPFANGSFDVVTNAFGVRNLSDPKTGLQEMYRVLRPKGKFACLELSQPENRWFLGLYRRYFAGLLPLIGYVILKQRGPYDYLPASVWNFQNKAGFSALIGQCGFQNVQVHSLWGGTVAIFLAGKPGSG